MEIKTTAEHFMDTDKKQFHSIQTSELGWKWEYSVVRAFSVRHHLQSTRIIKPKL